MGSLKELDHFLNIANKLSYITKEEYDLILIKVNVIGKKLSSLINKIKTDKNRATSH